MKVSVAVMAHPLRERIVAELLTTLPAGTPVVWDEKNDRWDTGRRSMLAHDPAADWHLVIQDDAIVCNDFEVHLHRALATLADGPAAFYMGRTGAHGRLTRTFAKDQRLRGVSWLRHEGPWWGVAVAVRPVDIGPMIEWCDQRTSIPNYDRRMSRYFSSIGRQCWYSLPSLVEHRTHGNPSLVAGRGHLGRTALWWEPVVRGPWTGGSVAMPLKDPTPKGQSVELRG